MTHLEQILSHHVMERKKERKKIYWQTFYKKITIHRSNTNMRILSSPLQVSIDLGQKSYTEETTFPIPFTSNGTCQQRQHHPRLWTKKNSICFKIERKTVTMITSHSPWKETEINFSQCKNNHVEMVQKHKGIIEDSLRTPRTSQHCGVIVEHIMEIPNPQM